MSAASMDQATRKRLTEAFSQTLSPDPVGCWAILCVHLLQVFQSNLWLSLCTNRRRQSSKPNHI